MDMDNWTVPEQGFIAHVVKWALILPVSVRQEIILSARQHARLCRQPRPGVGGSIVFAKPEIWEEIARRVETEGRTPPPDTGQE
jgi:hypothetical protein